MSNKARGLTWAQCPGTACPHPRNWTETCRGAWGLPGSCGWELSLEGAVPSCPQQCEWVRCLELKGRAGHECLQALSHVCPQPQGQTGRQSELSAEAESRAATAIPAPPRGSPFPSVPRSSSAAGAVLVLLGARKGPLASTASRKGRGEAEGAVCQSDSPPLLPNPGW